MHFIAGIIHIMIVLFIMRLIFGILDYFKFGIQTRIETSLYWIIGLIMLLSLIL